MSLSEVSTRLKASIGQLQCAVLVCVCRSFRRTLWKHTVISYEVLLFSCKEFVRTRQHNTLWNAWATWAITEVRGCTWKAPGGRISWLRISFASNRSLFSLLREELPRASLWEKSSPGARTLDWTPVLFLLNHCVPDPSLLPLMNQGSKLKFDLSWSFSFEADCLLLRLFLCPFMGILLELVWHLRQCETDKFWKPGVSSVQVVHTKALKRQLAPSQVLFCEVL